MPRGHRGGHHHHHHHHFNHHRSGSSSINRSFFHHHNSFSSFGMYGHRSRGHYSGGGGNRGRVMGGTGAEAIIDGVASYASPPTLENGIFSFSGNHMSAMTHLDNYSSLYNSYIQSRPDSPPIYQANLTIVGAKTSPASSCCQTLTIILAVIFIIPFFFMCCMWWKKIVYPKYQINPETYRALARFVRQASDLKTLNLTVVDNSFGPQKASIIYDILSTSLLTIFSFKNMALDCDYDDRQATDFEQNMYPIKSLPLSSAIAWGDMIL